ncbi:MAG: hypothetical protein HYW91_02900 [Candidatus Sungbacteria bacterium]|nr:hypothetical protein [Candidatus Sungbacteria bacterium]
MYFEKPALLLLALLVFLPLLFPRVRRAIPIPSLMVVRESTAARLFRYIWQTATVLSWSAAFLAATIIVAWPLEDKSEFQRKEKVRKICVVGDMSTSMSGEGVKRLQEILHAFVDKRKGDWMCLTAYSGSPGQEGGARVIQPLTPDIALMHKAIDRLQSGMFGSHTAIGEGIWTTAFALRERELQAMEKKKIFIDLLRLREEMKEGVRTYFLYVTGLLGKQENEVMVFFTDGYYNTGLHPSVAMSIVIALGIRMYVGILDPTGATGLSQDTAEARQHEMKMAAKKTGGGYFRGKNYDEIAGFYDTIDRIERREMVVEISSTTRAVFDKFGWALPFLTGAYIVMAVTFIRIRGKKKGVRQ